MLVVCWYVLVCFWGGVLVAGFVVFSFIELACGFFVSVGAWELLCCVVGVFPCRVVGGL